MGSKKYRNREKVERQARPEGPDGRPVTSPQARFNLLIVIVLCVAGFLVYSNTFRGQFYFDDKPYIVGNYALKNLSDLGAIWSFYPTRFITNITFAINYHVHGLDVFGYHLVNLCIHIAAAVAAAWLAFLTLCTPKMREEKIGGYANIIALFTGLIFAVHPLQTQAVTFIVQRAASLATLSFLVTVCLYAKSDLAREAKSGLWTLYYAASFVMAVVTMFTKEMVVTLPFILLLYELIFLRAAGRSGWKAVAPFFLTLVIIPVSMLATGSVDLAKKGLSWQLAPAFSSSEYLFTQFRVLGTYIRLLFIPLNQNLDYDYPIIRSLFDPRALAALAFLAAVVFAAIKKLPKYRLVSFGVFWFFIVLLPESSIIPITDVIFEHRVYLAMFGYAIFLAGAAYYLLNRYGRAVVIAALVVITACYSGLAYMRNDVWKDELSLWDDAARKSPGKARPLANRGLALEGLGMFEEALADYNRAIMLNPNYAEAYGNRGNIYFEQKKDPDKALADYDVVARLNPNDPNVYNNRGCIYKDKGEFTKAVAEFDKSIKLDRNNAGAYYNRALAYAGQDKYDEAITDFNKTLELDPRYAAAYYFRGVTYYCMKDYSGSAEDMERAKAAGFSPPEEFLEKLRAASN